MRENEITALSKPKKILNQFFSKRYYISFPKKSEHFQKNRLEIYKTHMKEFNDIILDYEIEVKQIILDQNPITTVQAGDRFYAIMEVVTNPTDPIQHVIKIDMALNILGVYRNGNHVMANVDFKTKEHTHNKEVKLSDLQRYAQTFSRNSMQ